MGSLLNKREGEPDDDDDEAANKSRRVTWRSVSKNSSRTTSHPDDASRPKRRVSRYTVGKYSRCRVSKRFKRYRLRRGRSYRSTRKPRRRYRSRCRERRRRHRRSVGSRRKRRRSEQRYRRRRLTKITRSDGQRRRRKRGRPRKNAKSLVYGGSRSSLVRKQNDELRRFKHERLRNRRTVQMREVNTKREVERVFKPQDKVLRKVCDKGIDDIQENPLSVRSRCSSVVDSIPGIPYDGRKRREQRRNRTRNKQAKMRAGHRRYTRRHSSYARKHRRSAGVKRRYRKSRANTGDRNRNAIGSPPRLTTKQVLYRQSELGEYCRPSETKCQSTSSNHGSYRRACRKLACPYSRRGVETSRSLRSCSCYCCRLRNRNASRNEAGDISGDGCCRHCQRSSLTTKRRTAANSRPRRQTRRR